MATQSPKAEKAPKSKQKGAKKDKAKGDAAGLDAEPKAREGTPRLQTYYESIVRGRLAKEFGLDNPMQVPRLEKIILNVGLGEAPKNPKQLEAALDELGRITGQKAVVTRAKKAISNFSLRAGMPIGARVTLRGARMYEFLDRFVTLAVPRLRDFRGLPAKSFDGRGNYSVGIKEQMIFPEVDFDRVEKIHGMDITVVTTAKRDDMAMALLREFGWPFRGETPLRVG
jgi:large subunit ribosomal protein L5